MSIYFVLLAVGTAAFALSKSRASVYWIGFYAASIYSMPLAFGFDLFGRRIGDVPNITMCLVMSASLAMSVARRRAEVQFPVEVDRRAKFIVPVAVGLSCLIFAVIPLTYGLGIFETHKTESGIGALVYVGWRLSASTATVVCVLVRRYKLAIIAAIPLFASLFAGDRTAVGLTAVAVTWVLLQTGRVKGMKLVMFGLGIVAVGVFLFFGKTFQAQLASGTFVSLADLARTIAEQGSDSITRTEPFGTIGVFNALITLTYGPPDSVIFSAIAQIFPMPSLIGFDSGAFNDFFQPILFPDFAPRSLAYSFWGEAYVRAGWFGVLAFVVLHLIGLSFFDRMSRMPGLAARTFAYLGGAYWAFYVHRNSLASLLAYERQILLYICCLIVFASGLRIVNRRVNS